MVPAAVDLSVLEEVDEVDQQLAAGDALEALRVPAAAVTSPTGKHSDVAAADLSAALEIDGGSGRCRGKEVRWPIFLSNYECCRSRCSLPTQPCNH